MKLKYSDKRFLFTAMLFAVAAMAVFCVMADSDDSSAVISGDVLNSSDVAVGTWAYNESDTLNLTAPTATATTSVTLNGFPDEQRGSVEVLNITLFSNNIIGSFEAYTNLETVTYKGTVESGGNWEFDYYAHTLSITQNMDENTDSIYLPYFKMQSLVESVVLDGYTKDLSESFTDYPNVYDDKNITYKGDFSGSNGGGTWVYSMADKKLTVDRIPDTTNKNPGRYNKEGSSNVAPFMSMFFKDEVQNAEYLSFTEDSANLFYGLSSLKTFYARDFTQQYNNGLLSGMTALEELTYDSITYVEKNTISPVKSTLLKFTAKNVNRVADSTFVGATNLSNVSMPSVTEIGQSAFNGCTALISVDVVSCITVNKYAFEGCSALKNINLPSATSLLERSFYGCTSLKTATLTSATSVDAKCFEGCSDLSTVAFSNQVSLGDRCFMGCISLTNLTFSYIKSIGYDAFNGCTALYGESGALSFDNLTTIRSNSTQYPFRGCNAIEKVYLPNISIMEPYALYGCLGLTTVTIGNKLTEISDYAFYGCTHLIDLTLGKQTVIGQYAFYGCTSLAVVGLPDSLETISTAAFANSGVVSIDTMNVEEIGNNAFRESKLSSLTLGPAVETIGDYAFYNTLLANDLEFPDSITTIGAYAFYGIHSPKITFADDDASTSYTLGNNSFQGCSELLNADLGGRIFSIGKEAFLACSNLSDLKMGSDITSIGDSAFSGCNSLATALDFHSKITYIGTDAFKETLISGLTFSADSKLESISNGAFQGCRSLRQIIQFPDSVKTIGKDSFNNTALKGISFNTLSSKLTTIGENAFLGSQIAGTLVLPVSLTTLGSYAFSGCEKITDVRLGPNILSLGTYAFANDTGLTSVTIPNTVNSLTLSEGLFSGCKITEIYIPSSVTSIGNKAFTWTSAVASQVNLWFNGPMSNITLSNGAFIFNGNPVLNVFAESSSSEIASGLKTNGKATGVASVSYQERAYATIVFSVDNATPVYTSITAVYGSKIILPYYRMGETYDTAFYSVIDNTPTYLSVFATESDFENGRIASSGDAVPVYPLEDRDNVSMKGSKDTTSYLNTITVVSSGNGLNVVPSSQKVHYGGTLTIPKFERQDIVTNSITLNLADGYGSYSLDLDTVNISVGRNYGSIVLGYEPKMVWVTFISKGETVKYQVQLMSKFELPAELSYMEEAPIGYEFNDWWDAEGDVDGLGGHRATEDTQFNEDQTWYAHFRALSYTFSLKSTTGGPSIGNVTETMRGPYTLHVVDGSLYYTDAIHTVNELLFSANSVPGWSVSNYEDNSGRIITVDSDVMTDNVTLYVRMQMNEYDITLRFYSGGSELSASEKFYIEGWAIGDGTEYVSGSVIENVSYSYIENGLVMPVPVNQTHAFNNMVAGSTTIPNINGVYTLTLAYFESPDSITITYNVDTGVYTVLFAMNDDASTTASVGPYKVGDSFWLRAADYYTKTGYTFSKYSIAGGGEYSDRQDVVLTDAMAANASYCVITVNALWTPITYTVSFDLDPYEGTVPTQSVTNGGTVAIPDVSANHGYFAASWYWFKDEVKSEVFTEAPTLTSEIISTYADGQNISIGVNWELTTYVANVYGSPAYAAITGLKLGDPVTLWTHTYTPEFKEFGGWAVGSQTYAEGDNVFDLNMAEAGDSNGGVVSFNFVWNDIRYHVQYNLNGGAGTSPADENEYVIGDPLSVAPYDEEQFHNYGYTFVGWKYSLDDDTVFEDTTFTEDLARNSTVDTHTAIFYAVWAQKSYKINYELDGGRYGTSAPTNVRYGDEVTISNPTRVGYSFEGWTAVGLTSGAKYLSKSNFYMTWNGTLVDSESFKDLTNKSTDKVTASVTLTAHWAEASYTTEYLPNGGTWNSISSSQYQISIGDVIELPTVKGAKKTGYNFAGWGVDTVNIIPAGTKLTEAMISDPTKFTLYAIWTPVVYEVQYRYTTDYDYSTVNVDYGSTLYVPILDRAGYTFRGWTISGAGLEAEYSRDGSEWYKLGSSLIDGTYFRNLTSDSGGIVTMEAGWNPISYRLSYNTNGGTGKAPVDSNTYHVGDPVVMQDYKSLIGTNGSKVVIGWSLEINGSAVNVTEFTQGLCSVADATNTVNLYAVWVNDMCTVIVDLEGAKASSVPAGWVQNADGTYEKLVNYGTDTKSALQDWDDVVISKDGYNFSGWEYDTATVMSSVTAYPTFEKVSMNILYVFGGIIAVFAVGAVIATRF